VEGHASESTTEMTGTNCTLDAARNGPERSRQLLGKEKLADGNLFILLTAHVNGRPLLMSGNEIAKLPKDGEPGAGWRGGGCFFIPALWQEFRSAPTHLFIPLWDDCVYV
jgi:hypothetical protein